MMLFIIVVVIGALVTAYFMMGSGDAGPATGPAQADEQAVTTVEEDPMETTGGEDANAEEVPDNEEVVEKQVDERAPQSTPDGIEGLVGWYDGESWDAKANEWKDKSGKNNHVTEIRGDIEQDSDESSNNQKFIFGSTLAGMRFPQETMSTGRKYTLVHVAKYAGSVKQRIFQGTNNNFISGFVRGHTGTAHRDGSGWISHWDNEGQERFIVHVDQKHLLRKDGLRRSGLTNFSALIPSQLSVNYGQVDAENSDFAIAEVLLYSRELSTKEIRQLENFLMRKYKIMKKIRAGVHMHNTWRRGDGFDSIDGLGADCGDEGALYWQRVNRVANNTGRVWDTACIQGLDGGITEKKTSYISKGAWDAGMPEMPISCGDKAIAGFQFEESKDKSKVRMKYQCHNHAVNTASCSDEQVSTAFNGAQGKTMNEALGGVATNCGPNRVMTSLKVAKDNDGRMQYKYTCCNLEDA